ncbi:glycosyltransferase [Moorena sp. SIOASIH]|uniref:glycosyltransferase family 2 protein n=1 Tax=Moorena sp. SIOASIH TaxID=2607817 RepID=UPI0025DAF500|nr:glycosyltransferase [Moorena sp. SIOASIH]
MGGYEMIPQVSVIIPSYNCDRYITEAVESALNQEACSYEVVVIDDGSTDQTRSVLQPYRGRIRYIYQENQGVSLARNHGIKLANGEFVAFLDADDFFLPGKLAAQLAVFEAQPHLGIVHSGWYRVDAQGKPLMTVRPWEKVPELNLESWLLWKPVLPSAMMFRRHWLEAVGGFDPRFPPAEDTEIVLRLALKGCPAVWLRQVTVGYRQHHQSAMHKGLPQARSLSAAIDNFFQQAELPPGIRLLENQVRYGTLVWIAWYLYNTGHPREMIKYLQQAWGYSPYLPMETVVHWADNFAEFSRNWGGEFDADGLGKSPEWQQLMQWVMAQGREMMWVGGSSLY